MKFIKKRTKDDLAYDDESFYDDEYYGTTPKEGAASFDGDVIPTVEDTVKTAPQTGVSFGGSAPVALKVIKPKGYDDGPEIADFIAGGSTVLLNIEQLDRESTKRLLDFLLGATHVLGGSMKMVARGTFVFAPRSVGVTEVNDEEEAENAESTTEE